MECRVLVQCIVTPPRPAPSSQLEDNFDLNQVSHRGAGRSWAAAGREQDSHQGTLSKIMGSTANHFMWLKIVG